MGAAADQPGGDAGHAAAVHRDRVPVHLLGAGAPGGDRARLPASWCDNGMDRFVVLDPSHDMDAARATARIAKKAGGREVIGALTYTISAVHDDAFYAGIAAQYAACADIDRAYIKDPAGILTPDRARTLIPAVQAALRRQAAGAALARHARAVAAHLPDRRRRSACTCCRSAAARSATAPRCPTPSSLVANLRASGHTRRRRRPAARRRRPVLRPARRGGGAAAGHARLLRRGVHGPPAGGRHHVDDQAAAGRARARRPVRRADGGDRPGAGRARLPDHGDALPADGDRAGPGEPAVGARAGRRAATTTCPTR